MDATTDALTHGAGQGGAARPGVVSATHAAQVGGQIDGQPVGHTATLALQFGPVEVDPQAGAAGATAGAEVVVSGLA